MGNAILDQRGGDSLTATTLDGYSLLADTTVSSATTTVNFTGLNIGWGDELLLVSDVKYGASGNWYSLFVNGNTTSTNYYRQQLSASSTSVGSQRTNDSTFGYVDSYIPNTFSFIKIKLTNNGNFIFQTENMFYYSTPSYFESRKIYGTSLFTISSIFSLTVQHASSNGIGVGSRFQLYKSGGGASRTWAIT